VVTCANEISLKTIISTSATERSDLFLTAGRRLGAPLINIKKDFWVCWTLNCLYHRLQGGSPRLLFKGGTSLSKAYALINRFSEDIDITIFRDDLGHTQTQEELDNLSNKKRKAALNAINDDCHAYITGPLLEEVSLLILEDTDGKGRIEVDPSGETGYVQAAVKIESGAKSALDPNAPRIITPYISDDVSNLNLSIPNVTTIDAERTFWDKVVILHGLCSWFKSRGELKQDGQRVSRHYYDLHCMLASDIGQRAITDDALGRDCVAHAKTFFNRPAFDLNSAATGTFTLVPSEPMLERLRADYHNTEAMIFGDAPTIEDFLGSIKDIEKAVNTPSAERTK
jgi:hypothetical protein